MHLRLGISDSRASCIRLDTSYYAFLERYGMDVRSFRVTQPDGSSFVIRASAARINTANPHAASSLLTAAVPDSGDSGRQLFVAPLRCNQRRLPEEG